MDYDRYANGEAVLGWLNMTLKPVWKELVEGTVFLERFFGALRKRLEETGTQVGHVKLMCPFPDGLYIGNMADRNAPFSIRREDTSGPGLNDAFIVNARVECEPEALEAMIREALERTGGEQIGWTVCKSHCLKPGRPNPTHRYTNVV